MKIKMPVEETAVCVECNCVQQVMWSEYGAIAPCISCDEAPAKLMRCRGNCGGFCINCDKGGKK